MSAGLSDVGTDEGKEVVLGISDATIETKSSSEGPLDLFETLYGHVLVVATVCESSI